MVENIEAKQKSRFKITKWIMLSFAILFNAFIVFYSCLNGESTNKLNSFFTNTFVSFINSSSKKEVKNTPLSNINITFSDEQSYKYNYLPGYDLDTIPLGSAKQIQCSYEPSDATNKSIIYTAEPNDIVELNQSGSLVSVVGMKTGVCTISAKSKEGNLISSLQAKVVEPIAPPNFTVSVDKTAINIGEVATMTFDIDGGVLGHDELINFRYYDTRKLVFSSSNEAVATIDKFGVIHPVSSGTAIISVENTIKTETFTINVNDGVAPSNYSNLSIQGTSVCYADDMILDQNSKINHFEMKVFDSSVELNPEDFIWESSNNLLMRIDRHGILRGFRKTTLNDEKATITATSKLTNQIISKEISVVNRIPEKMNFVLRTDGYERWDLNNYTFCVGDKIKVQIEFDVRTKQLFTVESTDEAVIEPSNEGSSCTLVARKPGTASIKIIPQMNTSLSKTTTIKIVEAGAIETDSFESIGHYLRKSIGHAAVFMVAQVFTLLSIYMFLYKKNKWLQFGISLGEGLFICILSESIQTFIPSRGGAVKDVFIDFAGVVIGFFIAVLIIYLINAKKNKLKE